MKAAVQFVSCNRIAAATLLLISLARADDIGRGGIKKTIPAGSDSAVIVLKNKVVTNGVAEEIIDLDIAINTPGASAQLAEVDVNGITEATDDTWVDDDNDESLEAGENDDAPPAPSSKVRLEVHGGSSDGRIDPNHDFELRIELDEAAGPGGVEIQITPTDKHGDAFVYAMPLDGGDVLVSLPAGSNDAYLELVNATAATLEQLVVGAAPPATLELAKTWSPTLPWSGDVNGWAVLAGGAVPPGGVVLAHVQIDGEAQPQQPLALRIRSGALPATFCQCVSGPCDNDDPQAGCRNSTGVGARIAALGTPSISEDNLLLRASDLPPNKFGLFFMGKQPTSQPFGDGGRCVGGSLYRFPIRTSGPAGEITFGPVAGHANQSFPPSGHVLVGSVWYFQGWYRDPQGPCGSGFNVTDATRVQFDV